MADHDLLSFSVEWPSLIEGCSQVSGLDPEEQERAALALTYLQSELFDGAERVPSTSPLFSLLVNPAAWTRRCLMWMAEALIAARTLEGGDILYRRLRERRSYAEALSVLGVGDRLRRAGFQLAFDRPSTCTRRMPDLTVWCEGTAPLGVEVTAMEESRGSREAFVTMARVHAALEMPPCAFIWGGRILRALAPPHLDEVVRKIVEATQGLGGSRTFVVLDIPHVVQLGIALPDGAPLLQEWADQAGIRPNSLEGPPDGSDEIARLRRKIGNEQRQLDPNGPNMIAIVGHAGALLTTGTERAVAELEEELYRYRHVLLTTVSMAYRGRVTPSIRQMGKHEHRVLQGTELLVEDHIVLRNRFCAFEEPNVDRLVSTAFSRTLF